MTESALQACPTDEQLSLLSEGKISGAELEQLERHLDGCDGCRRIFAVVSNGSAPTMRVERAVLQPGDRLGRYQVERLIAAGGMGMLYVARDQQLGRRVALKLMRPSIAADGGKVRLLREAQAMAQLSHPNVVSVYELGEVEGRVFVAMELIDGGTLRDWMKGAHTWKDTVEMFCAAGEGLAAAHRTGVVHRDFKPENVMVGAKDSRPRVGDFGLARPELVAEEEPPPSLLPMKVTHTGTMLGTPAYMSPEQLTGKPADARSDQYGFCVSLYEALAGHRPFPADTLEELRARVAGGMPPPPRDGLVPAHVWAAVARGLNPDPAKRFPDMEALLTVLRFPAPVVDLELAGRARRRARRVTIEVMAAGVVLVLAGAAAYWTTSPSPLATPTQPAPGRISRLADSLPGNVTLRLNDAIVLPLPGLERFDVGDPSRVVVERNGDELALFGVELGQTVMVVWLNGERVAMTVSVTDSAPAVTGRRVLEVLAGSTTSLQLDGIQQVVVREGAIAKAEEAPDGSLTIAGLRAGHTVVDVWTAAGKRPYLVTVVEPPPVPDGEDALPADPLPASVTLAAGDMALYRAQGVTRLAIGDPNVLDVKSLTDSKLLLIGVSAGTTTMLVWRGQAAREAVTVTVTPAGAAKPKPAAKPASLAAALPEARLDLTVGRRESFDAPGVTRVAVGDPNVLDITTLATGRLVFTGLAPGRTTVLIWHGDERESLLAIVKPAPAEPEVDAAPLSLALGAEKVITLPGVTRIAVGDPNIVEVKTGENDQLIIRGENPGATTLLVWVSNQKPVRYRVTVTAKGRAN